MSTRPVGTPRFQLGFIFMFVLVFAALAPIAFTTSAFAQDDTCVAQPTPIFDPENTVTIELHGWNLTDGAFPPDAEYGRDRTGSEISDFIRLFGDLPCGFDDTEAPNGVLGMRYYGDTPADFFTDEDVDEIEALEGIPRYALIVAKHARHVLDRTGATGVNFVCHSMGNLVARYVIEHDLESLVSDAKIVRWVTVAGVLTGADLARTFEDVVEAADVLGIDLVDVEHMAPDWVEDNVAICDGIRTEANNPAFAAIGIHHIVANDSIIESIDLPLLDLFNPDSLPNDGILFTQEQWFADQDEDAQYTFADGSQLPTSRTYHEVDHFVVSEDAAPMAVATAALTGTRRMRITLDSITLNDDREADSIFDFSETGFGAAEVVVETEVAWPYLEDEYDFGLILDERDRNNRVVPVISMDEGDTIDNLGLVLYDSPVLDAMDEIELNIDLREVDWYPTADVTEWLFDADSGLGSWFDSITIEEQTIELTLDDADLTLEVEIFDYGGAPVFLRGDANASGGVEILDALEVLTFLFADGESPQCMGAADADASGSVSILDAQFVLLYLFAGGTTPEEPFLECGPDPTGELPCATSTCTP